jgi:hypothetical protein
MVAGFLLALDPLSCQAKREANQPLVFRNSATSSGRSCRHAKRQEKMLHAAVKANRRQKKAVPQLNRIDTMNEFRSEMFSNVRENCQKKSSYVAYKPGLS